MESIDNKTINKMKETLEKTFYKYFPNGYFDLKVAQSIGNKYIVIRFGLIGDTKDLSGGYRDNDPMKTVILIQTKTNQKIENHFSDDVLYTMKLSQGGLLVKPAEGSYMAYDNVKIPLRSKTSTIDKMIPNLKKYIEKLASTVKETGWDRISFDGNKYPDKYMVK
jgi:hypothetical protein